MRSPARKPRIAKSLFQFDKDTILDLIGNSSVERCRRGAPGRIAPEDPSATSRRSRYEVHGTSVIPNRLYTAPLSTRQLLPENHLALSVERGTHQCQTRRFFPLEYPILHHAEMSHQVRDNKRQKQFSSVPLNSGAAVPAFSTAQTVKRRFPKCFIEFCLQRDLFVVVR